MTSFSRRRFLARGATVAAGVGLATLAGPAHRAVAGAPTTGPVTWRVVGNGAPGDIRFWKRLKRDFAWGVDSGYVADAYGDSALVYNYGFGGVMMARLVRRDLHYFQIWRSTGGTQVGPSGQFYDYTWNGTNYTVGGPYSWHTSQRVNGDDPWQLPVDNEEKASFDVISDSAYGHFPGWMRELHHYNGPGNERQLWGSVYGESFAGYSVIDPPLYTVSQSGSTMWRTYRGPYNFLRALDPEFRSFQVYRGTIERVEQYEDWQFVAGALTRYGTATHIDTVSGAQYPITWRTD